MKEYLGLSFNSNGDIAIEPPRKAFEAKLRLVVKSFLSDDSFDTRTDPEDVFGAGFKKFKTRSRTSKKAAANPPPPPPPAPPPSGNPPPNGGSPVKPDRFFESLSCRVADHSIAAIVGEIKKVSPETYPIAATYLLRTLMELCLRRIIAQTGRQIPGKHDPALTELVNFALNNRDVFPSPRMADVIESARSQRAIDYLNIVVHQKWMDADPTTVKSVANQLRSFVRHIVQGAP